MKKKAPEWIQTLAKTGFCQLSKSFAKWKNQSSPIVWQNSLGKLKKTCIRNPETETKLFFHPFCLRALVDARFGGKRIYARFGPSNAKSHQFAKPNAKRLERTIHRFWQKKMECQVQMPNGWSCSVLRNNAKPLQHQSHSEIQWHSTVTFFVILSH